MNPEKLGCNDVIWWPMKSEGKLQLAGIENINLKVFFHSASISAPFFHVSLQRQQQQQTVGGGSILKETQTGGQAQGQYLINV